MTCPYANRCAALPSSPDPLKPIIGGHFYWDWGGTKIYMSTDSIDGRVKILVENEEGGRYVDVRDNLVIDFAVSGAGGLHNNYSFTASTCFVIHAAYNSHRSRSSDLKLFGVPASATVNKALVQALTGGRTTFNMWSPPLMSIATNPSGVIWDFIQTPQGWVYLRDNVVLKSAAKETAWTFIDLSAFVPNIRGMPVERSTIGQQMSLLQLPI